MADDVLLNIISRQRLLFITGLLACVWVLGFILGGAVAPAPTNVMNSVTIKCIDHEKLINSSKWFFPRGPNECDEVHDLIDKKIFDTDTGAHQIVFSQWLPLPRGGTQLDMSRWFQTMAIGIQPDVAYNQENTIGPDSKLRLLVRLGYRNRDEPQTAWRELIKGNMDRTLTCSLDKRTPGYLYNCDLLPFLELGSVHYDYYLINIRIPENITVSLGQIEDVHVVAIFQNGGFTKVLFYLKTIMSALLLPSIIWFCYRVRAHHSLLNLHQRSLVALSIVLMFFNVPIEWLTLVSDIPAMGLINAVRQVSLYCMLLSFCNILVGKHMVDHSEDKTLRMAGKSLGVTIFGCVLLLVFELCDKGMPLKNPLWSLWATKSGTNFGLAAIITCSVLATGNFIFLTYKASKVIRIIHRKKAFAKQGNQMKSSWRPICVVTASLLCTALTIIFFIITNVQQAPWKWGATVNLEYTGSFLTGVYGTWNMYVIGLLYLYAPSKPAEEDTTSLVDDQQLKPRLELQFEDDRIDIHI